MATFYVKNALFPDNSQLFIIDLMQVVTLRGEANTSFWPHRRGEHYWKFVIYTSGLDISGNSLGPFWVGEITDEDTIDELINNKVKEISGLIDWRRSPVYDGLLTAQEDRYPPKITYMYPLNGAVNVPISSRIVIRLVDLPPATGVDFGSVTLSVNGLTIIPEITGNPFDCTVSYKPLSGA